MFYDDDIRSVMENGEFSEDIVIENDSVTITTKGFFDETFQQIDPETGAVVMSKNPRVSIFDRDIIEQVGEIREGWTVRVRGVTYRIKSPQSDGAGLSVLELKRA